MSASPETFKNYYEVLRVRPHDPPELIHAAFLSQIKQWHPDKFANADAYTIAQAQERSKLILDAKRRLCDPVRKAAYDQEFATRFPRRFEKLSTKARVKQRQFTVEDLMSGAGFPINAKVKQENADESYRFRWLAFSTRVNPRTKRVIFNAAHFLDNNPDCEVRFKLDYDLDWTPFSRERIHVREFKRHVALAEMQARRVTKKSGTIYSDRILKTVVITNYAAAMKQKAEILTHLNKLRNRMALKLIIALLGSAFIPLKIAPIAALFI
jgi:curved DNA-binding protein CbpA